MAWKVMQDLSSALKRYQQRIGAYDQHDWERNVEQKLLEGLGGPVPKKTVKLLPELIDVDIIRGSSFGRAKPLLGFVGVTWVGLKAAVFFPLWWAWWRKHLDNTLVKLMCIAYCLQIGVTAHYLGHRHSDVEAVLTCTEVGSCFIAVLALSVLHAHMTSTLKPAVVRDARAGSFSQSSRGSSEATDGGCGGGGKTSQPPPPPPLAPRWRRAISEDPGCCRTESPRLASVLAANKKFKPKGMRRVRRKSCGTMTSTEEKNSSGESSECQTTASGLPGKTDASDDVDYWSGATTNSEEDCCNYTSTELDDDGDADGSGAGAVGGGGGGVGGPAAAGPRVPGGGGVVGGGGGGRRDPLFFHDSLLFPFDCGGAGGGLVLSCMIWGGSSLEAHKADLSVLDISSAIVRKVEFSSAWDSSDYLWIGVMFSCVLALIPAAVRVAGAGLSMTDVHLDQLWPGLDRFADLRFIASSSSLVGSWALANSPVVMLMCLRFILAFLTFFLLSVAERTFKRRYMLAKMFHCLTSARRAKRWDLPHFRLSKVRNIKTWLSVRSYLKRHGPQRSVDVIVSAAFVATLALMTGICVDMLRAQSEKPSSSSSIDENEDDHGGGGSSEEEAMSSLLLLPAASVSAYTDAVVMCLAFAVFLLRFMTLGVKINSKYRDISVLITEQINLYLRMEQKPHKKDQLILANNVLKLAADLIKELESPFKISGLSANPILYNVTKMVVLSAFSAVLTEMLGFKLKLYKLKFKA
ncbi:unnamed protein product [Notodromas monacha]|uniref:PHTF1/2 N-terminal domain-containing protein n=1 Tax=Notodromas monacha TaxID=399045 RepID=A0A7R9GI51_9CRUS|nr:unnamed protein product [Notodromas monacha]CAG0922065.1 unnamed protein product [Notodromas monacha]